MNLQELDKYSLEDAVKFHDRLNPRLWGEDEHLLPEVSKKLLASAAEFQEFLGVPDLDAIDITVSGSNAAYSYTPHSDIDLHLVVAMPEQNRKIFQELFNAKKYEFNDQHNIKIRNIDVEFYVQPSDEDPKSQGIYSLKDRKWLQVPRRRRAEINDSCVKAKAEDLDARIHSAINAGDVGLMQTLWQKIKTMRQTGLESNGEFGCENLTFKILRSGGCLKKLKLALNQARDHELSLQERKKKKKKVRYGFGGYWNPGFDFGSESGNGGGDGGGESMREGHQGSMLSSPDGVSASTQMFVNETGQDENVVQNFIADTAKQLGIKNMPKVYLHRDDDWAVEQASFGMYQPETHELHVNLSGRHLMDILRTTAHELVHCRQHELKDLPNSAGNTGSPWENQAHAVAGMIMRNWADAHPELFDRGVMEGASGYIPTAKEKNDPRYSMALTVDIKPGEVGRQANKMALKTNSQGRPKDIYQSVNQLHESLSAEIAQEFALLEAEFLPEIKMSPQNLRAEAAKTGAMAGMEFEMIVPGVGGIDSEPEYEPDYDQDLRARSFDGVEEFFFDGDYNSRGDVRRLMEALGEAYMEWQMDQTADAWDRDGVDFMRDYIANNDEFDRDEALTQARDEITDANPDLDTDSEEFNSLLSNRVNELEEQFVLAEFEAQGRLYNAAFEEFAQEKNDDYDEREFLQEVYPYMTDIAREFDIAWPHYTTVNADSGGTDGQLVADEFSSYMGKPVNYSDRYHGGRREPGTYVVEPDGSLEGDNPGDAGLEFVSPPMPIDEMLADLKKVKEWAGRQGAYTNDSTGLHINISVPDYSLEKLDYVKLALLMGDEYVLELFGRSSNTYAKAATSKIRDVLKKNPDLAPTMMDKMRSHMGDFATKAIHSGTTDKYTSINTKTGYIEFRSPGGDWLDANFDKIESTLLRFTVALSAAIDPAAYRQEYLKKLYKLLEGSQDKGGVDVLQLFANYSAGELPKDALIRQVRQSQLARKAEKGTERGKKYWWNVQWDSNRRIEVVASNKEVARQVAAEEWDVPESQLAGAKITVLRPYEEKPTAPAQQSGGTGNWGIWAHIPQRFVGMSTATDAPVRRFETQAAAEAWLNSTNLDQARFDVAEIPADYQRPAPQSRPAANQQYQYSVSLRSDPSKQVEVQANTELEAIRAAGEARPNWFGDVAGRSHEFKATIIGPAQPAAGSGEPIPGSTLDRARQRATASGQQTGTHTYRAFDSRNNQTLGTFQADEPGSDSAAEEFAAMLSREGISAQYADYEVIGQERRQPAQTTQTLTRPGQQQTFTGQWDVMIGNEVVFRVPAETQGEANAKAREWILGRSREFLNQYQGQEVSTVPRYQ
jgi:hypothetical protein